MKRLAGEAVLKDRNISISRSQLVCGTVKIDNERALESHLKALGFEIIYPEQLSFDMQIFSFRNNNIVVGPVGSAFHTPIFTPAPCGVALNMKNAVDSNYLMMDGINEACIDYITVRPNMGRSPVSTPVNVKFYDVMSHDGSLIKLDPLTGHLSSCDDRRFMKLLLAIFYEGDQERAFFISNGEKLVGITIHDSASSGLAVPVDLVENGAGWCSFFLLEDQRYLCALPASQGG